MGQPRKGKGTGKGQGSNKRKAEQARGDRITPEQETFCQEYVLNGDNGAQAMLKARPRLIDKSNQYRAEQASKWLALSKIQTRISELRKDVAAKAKERFDISGDRILQELAAMAFSDFSNYFEFGTREVPIYNKKTGEPEIDMKTGRPKVRLEKFATLRNSADLTENQRKAVVQVGETISRTGEKVIEVKLADKRGALNDLAKITGLIKNTVELTGRDGGPIESVTHSLPDLDGATDPKAMLRAFEDFRMGRTQGTKH